MMLIHNPKVVCTVIAMHHHNKVITFTKLFSYPVCTETSYTTNAWIGKNNQGEFLTIVFNKNLTSINYLAHTGHYYAKGLPQDTFTLKKNVSNFKKHCLSPKFYGKNPLVNNINTKELPPDLNIRVVFYYAPEYLKTYKSLLDLKADNNDLCAVAATIFTMNNPTMNVEVMNAGNIRTKKIQEGEAYVHDEGMYDVLIRFVNNQYPKLIKIKQNLLANVVVLQVAVADPEDIILGIAYEINFKAPNNACLSLGRDKSMAYPSYIVEYDPSMLCHEMGHLLGGSHPLENGDTIQSALLPGYAHATFNSNDTTRNGTMMSNAERPVWYFSNPTIFKYGTPDQNIPCGELGVAEAYKVIVSNLPRLAASV